MHRLSLFSVRLCACLIFLFACSSSVHAQEPLKLWYRQPAQKWTDALPIGNGWQGAMIYGNVEREHLQLNESTLWTGRPREYQHKGAVQYLGRIRQLLFDGKQKEAEALAEKQFMGTKDIDDSLYQLKRRAWLQQQRKDTSFCKPELNDGQWPQMQLPVSNGWETAGQEGLDGSVWFRTSFQLPETFAGKDLRIDLGRIRDLDFTYLNGHFIGSAEGIGTKRSYVIPAAYLKTGKNTIAIQVINFFDKGGFIGIKENRKIFVVYPVGKIPEEGVALPTNWQYHIQNDDPPPFPQYQASYQPFADLYFDMGIQKESSGYARNLDIAKAVAVTSYRSGGTNYTRTYFASVPDHAIVTRFGADKPGSISLHALFSSPHRNYQVKKIAAHTLGLFVQVRNGAIRAAAYLYVNTTKGRVQVTDTGIRIDGADEAVFYLLSATNFVNYKNVSANAEDRCVQLLKKITAKPYQQVLNDHTRQYQSRFNRFSVQFGEQASGLPTDERIRNFSAGKDPSFFALYMQYARYLLLAASQPDASQPANLQGIWNNLLTPPWGSKYTTNINLQMNYWSAETLNLSDCTAALFKAIDELHETGTRTAQEQYGARGWVLHHNTDLWRGTAPINASNHGIWVSGAAWLCTHIWEHYLFTQDKDFLQQQYPVMKDAALFYADFLVRDPKTGWLISTPSNSPEQGGLVAGPAMDHQIIRELFRQTIAAARVLHADATLQKLLQQKITALAPNQIGKYGQLQEWLKDVDDTSNKHRHVSHLWGVYPGTDISWKDTAMMQAARQSLLYRGDEGTGWSLAWKTNLWARFKDGEHTLKMASRLLASADEDSVAGERGGVYKNLFDAHPPFQIDGNFGGAAGIAEMLVQSQGDRIELLPALPVALGNGYVKGICARGGFVLDIYWQQGILTKLVVVSKVGNTCKLQYGNKQLDLATAKNREYIFNKDLKQL